MPTARTSELLQVKSRDDIEGLSLAGPDDGQ